MGGWCTPQGRGAEAVQRTVRTMFYDFCHAIRTRMRSTTLVGSAIPNRKTADDVDPEYWAWGEYNEIVRKNSK